MVACGKSLGDFISAVRAVVVDKNDLPRDAIEGADKSFHHDGNIIPFVSGRNDNG
jgi:hypothetical protein